MRRKNLERILKAKDEAYYKAKTPTECLKPIKSDSRASSVNIDKKVTSVLPRLKKSKQIVKKLKSKQLISTNKKKLKHENNTSMTPKQRKVVHEIEE